MGDDAILAKPRKQRRLARGCGCLFLIALFLLCCGGGLFYFLSRWESGDTAWERLPAGTVWACQAHDLKTLLHAAARDPGASRLLLKGRAALNARLTHSKRDAASNSDVMEAYRRFGWLHTLVAPNSLVIGALAPEREKTFLVFQSPAWLRILGTFAGWDSDTVVEQNDDDTGLTFYFTPHEGWIIFAMDPGIIRTVLDGWDAGAMPLGNMPGGEGAHLFFAKRTAHSDSNPLPSTPGDLQSPTHFTFADPFAQTAGKGKNDTRDDGLATRLLVHPADAKWNIYGEVNGAGVFDSEGWTALGGGSPIGEAFMTKADRSPYDVMISARLSGESMDELLTFFRSERGSLPQPTTTVRRWLSESWLQNSGDSWTFLARPPAAQPELPYPSLPWLALGWSISDGIDPEAASSQFAQGMTQLVESFTASGDSPLRHAASGAFSISQTDAHGGVVAMPPVAVNGARPSWRFLTADMPPYGWVASDPGAIPEKAAAVTPLPPQPESGHVEMAGEWGFSKEFVESVAAVAEDRMRNLAALRPVGDRSHERLESALRVFIECASAFPRGSARVNLDTVNRRIRLAAEIPHGVDVR